ncbi:MAG TPA: hypothetical protein VK493_02160, partial [Bryobacteraceae bacterium]|nr:hypothetical protein [Bryobacteraceae bacterium]
MKSILLVCSLSCSFAAGITPDISGVKAGAIAVSASGSSLEVRWQDGASRQWEAAFSLDSSKPLIAAIAVDGRKVVERANPVFRCSTGKRRGGWDAFFDFPPSHPDGTRSFLQEFHPTKAVARTVGDRVEVSFDGMKLGIFSGSLRYVFYPGSALIEQAAVLATNEPDTAYYYDAGVQMTSSSSIAYFDTSGQLRTIAPEYGSERHPLAVRYRAVAAKTGAGSIVAFPSPHRYFFARDYTTNLGYAWYTSWRGQTGVGIRQLPDDNSPYYPWMNAPPGTEQEMGVFLLLGAGEPSEALQKVLAYTHSDRFQRLDGFLTFAPHWHLAYTGQAMAKGFDWQPPFKAAMENLGLDAAMIMDFHGDGHPSDLTDIRPRELDEYYKACRAQSGKKFLLIPAEEANVILGGHWGVVFPKPVYWYMDRKAEQPFQSADEKYGKLYRVHTPAEVWKMVTDEGGYVYQTHPRTKGSTGYPDKIRETDYFRDARFLGTGWKAMPSDLSSPRLGERAFRILDDMNNWGLHKRTIGEVDVFQLDTTHELYAHMNVNYLRLPELPDFDHYGRLLDAVAKGDGFVSTGEIVLPRAAITAGGGDSIHVKTEINYTFPLKLAEIVWGDGSETHRQSIDLQSRHEFGHDEFAWDVDAP